MSFLQPFLLWGLALAAVPIIIHLIHQRRFRTLQWGAMYFIRKAKQQAKGMARLKQWLILAMRTLAVLALAFAVSRPLSGGWVGKAGAGNLPLAIILMDRSPSMDVKISDEGETKREAGLRKVVEACERFAPSRVVLIENVHMSPIEVVKPADLLTLSEAGPSDKSTHWPTMLQKAMEYISANKPGNCQIWICSDLKENDWDLNNGLWASLRDEFPNLNDNVQILMVPMTQSAERNMGIRIQNAKKMESNGKARVELSLQIWREDASEEEIEVPVDINVNGSVSRSKLTFSGREGALDGIAIDIDPGQTNGWGWVKLPSDRIESDNTSFFSYSPFLISNTLLLNENGDVNSPFVWVGESAPDGNTKSQVQVSSDAKFNDVDLSETSLVIWDRPIPDDAQSIERLSRFTEAGGQLIFIASELDSPAAFQGVSFGQKQVASNPESPFLIENWKTDQDLLAHALDGTSLPVGELEIKQFRTIESPQSSLSILARMQNGNPLLAKANFENGSAYFLASSLDSNWSDLSSNGVVLYVLVQRAMAIGMESKQGQNFRVAGDIAPDEANQWSRLAGFELAPSTENAAIAGVYQRNEGQYIAVNRDPLEDSSPPVAMDKVTAGFGEIPLQILGTGNEEAESSVVSEIWRLFLLAMVVALLCEAFFSLPTRRTPSQSGMKGQA